MIEPITIRPLRALIAIAALAMLAGGCTILDPNPEATIGREGDAGPESGETLYIRNCAGCHGLSGVPADTAVKTLRGWPGDFAKFDSTLTLGPGTMPEFPQLDSAARRRIFEHIRKFPPL